SSYPLAALAFTCAATLRNSARNANRPDVPPGSVVPTPRMKKSFPSTTLDPLSQRAGNAMLRSWDRGLSACAAPLSLFVPAQTHGRSVIARVVAVLSPPRPEEGA